MYPRKLSLASRKVLRRLVRRAIATAIENAPEGELVESLAFELGRALRREGSALGGMTHRGVLTELALSSNELLEARDQASRELAEVESEVTLHSVMLDDAHGAMVRRADTDAPERDLELQSALAALFDKAARGELSLDELREATLDQVRRTSDVSREAMLAAWSAERDRQVDVLRRRLEKVNRSLEASEQALGRLAQQDAEDPGVSSIYRTVQGLDALTPDAARKRLLLAEIYRANLALREHREIRETA